MVNYQRTKGELPLFGGWNMKKKLLSLLLACGMAFGLAACGNSTPAQNNAPDVPEGTGTAAESDLAYIQDKGTFVIGMTDFAPMDYQEAGSDEWIGFDADMAKAFAASLGVEPEFIEITWDNKLMELETKAIDAVWNGMTLTDEVKAGASTSDAYCFNGQVVVVPIEKANEYQTVESLSGLNFAVENGSAGAAQLDELGIPYTALDTQARALMEVASGASDACVIDLLMAGAMIGEGTSYPNLTYTVQLNSEEYGVAFRKGSDLVDAFNAFWVDACADGTVMETANKYGVQNSVVIK